VTASCPGWGSQGGAETFSLANAPLIDAQAGIPFARALGGGLVAAIDGMRFVVPVPSVYARPNRKYFGPKRGVTWLNMINDQAAGFGGKVVAGTVRDSLHMIDVLFNQDGGQRPDIVVSDTGSYSDLVFGLVNLLGAQYRPALADLPDHKGWRISPSADYGPLLHQPRDGEIGDLDAAVVRAYLAEVTGLAPSTRRRKRAAVASFCRWAVRHDLLRANPMDKIDTIKVPRRLPRPAAAADVATVLAVICSRRREDLPPRPATVTSDTG